MHQKLEELCHCGAVKFTLESGSAVPYQLCFCGTCRKVAAGAGGTINLGGIAKEKSISGTSILRMRGSMRLTESLMFRAELLFQVFYHAMALGRAVTRAWHPFASAIDSPLKPPKEMACILMDSKAEWACLPEGPKKIYDHYGSGSLEDWHKHSGECVE
ncbi:unnamed protein product [Peniophora sp. CBMAI 1063]|nr:unnamed protein product [Peniophora sp. CBMAI 1063]